MSETLPPPPTNAGPPPSPTVAAPPGLVQAFTSVLTRPTEFFESLRGQAGFGPPVVFALVMGLLAGIVTAVIGMVGLGTAGGALGAAAGLGALVMSPIMAVVFGSFVGGAIVHVISMVAGGKGPYEQSVRISSYACAVMPIGAVLAVVPLLGIAANLYGLYIVAVGVVTLHLADRRRTFTAAVVLAVIVVIAGIASFFATRAAKDMSAEMEAKYGERSEFQREMQRATEEMKRAAEEMKRAQPR
jgi:hypothetical protein